MSGEEIILKFIQHEEHTDGDTHTGELLRKAFDEAKSRDINVQVYSTAELLKQNLENDKSLFVMDVFTGELFDSLLSQKRRIFGPLCVLRCLGKEIPLPNVYHPIFSLAMDKVVVSCTSVSRQVRDKLYELVERMGGKVAKDFTSAVTHLVAGEVGSKKYAIACKMKKVVVLPTWVEKAWERTHDVDFDANEAEFLAAHLCPIFKGCTVCLTGFQSTKRKEIQAAVEEHGGVYSAELKLKVTTHLLVEKPVGEKYEFAIRWNVHCVHPKWLYNCIEAGYWLDESTYLVRAERDLNKTRSTGGRLSVTTINATMNNTANATSSKAAEAAQRSSESHGHKGIFRETRPSITSAESGQKRGAGQTNNADFDYNVVIPSGEMFLDGCKIYLTGFEGQKLEQLQKIINAGGGTRFSQLNSSVSHVIMGEKIVKDVDILTQADFSPHIVTAKWLLDCCHQVRCLPEADYYCLEVADVVEDIPPADKNEPGKKQQSNLIVEKQQINNDHDEDDDDDVLYQYLDLMKDDDMAGISDIKTDVTTGHNDNQTTNDGEGDQKEEHDVEQNDNSMQSEGPQELFNEITIEIKGFAEKQKLVLQDAIESQGGSVVRESSTETAHYAIFPMNYKCENCTAHVMVTFCWLERSIESGRLLDPSSNFLFMPFTLADGAFPLKNCVISISQYSGIERDHLMQLAEMLGAHYQEFFSRRAKDNFLTNTHLLLQEPTGSKYEAAVRWEIPAITAEWLFECARTGKKAPEWSYMVDNLQNDDDDEVDLPVDRADKMEDKIPTLREVIPEVTNNDVLEKPTVAKFHESVGEMKPPFDIPKGKEPVCKVPKSNLMDAPPAINKPPAGFGRPEKPSFDLTDAIEVLQSPCCSSGSSSNQSRLSRGSRGSFLLDDYIQEHMQAALKNTSNVPGSRVSAQSVPSKDDTCEGRNSDPSETLMFLHGVIITVSKKLMKQQAELHNIASAVGADCRWSLDDTCTHVIHEGRLTKEHTQAKTKGIHIVSPHWLHDCIEEQRRVDESLYPATYNPKLTLSVVKTRRSGRDTKEIKSEVKVEKPEVVVKSAKETESNELKGSPAKAGPGHSSSRAENDDDEITDHQRKAELEGPISQESTQSDSLRTKEEIKQIKGLMQAMKTTRRRSRRLNSSNSGGHSGESTGESSKKSTRRQSSRLRSLRSEQDNTDEENDDLPRVPTITYDDPKSRLERERIIAQLSSCSPVDNGEMESEGSDDKDETIDEKQVGKFRNDYNVMDLETDPISAVKIEELSPPRSLTPEAPPIALQLTTANIPDGTSLLEPVVELGGVEPCQSYKFLLSAMSQQEKIDYGALIEQLGGEVFDNQYFNPVCSHTIVGQLNRNEKCLASIAAGNWVLHKSFLESSRLAGHFVGEEDHEWGVEMPGEQLNSLACAARRWRIELKKATKQHKTKCGAFQDWKILLCVEKSKLASFQRLLEAGGATVIDTTPPFADITGVTHAFISLGKSSPVENVDIDRLEKARILVLRTDYIANYLTDHPAPSTEKYVFKKLHETLNKKRKPEEDLEVTEKRQRRC